MKTHFEIIAFVTASLLAACGGTEGSSLLNTSEAPLASKSAPRTPSKTADAGTPPPAHVDNDPECYGEYCEQEHHHGDDDKRCATAADAGSPASSKGDGYSEDDCKDQDGDDYYEDEDRSGSNSGRH